MDNLNVTLFEQTINDFLTFLPSLIVALVFFLVTLYLSKYGAKLMLRTMENRDISNEVAILMSRIIQWSILILGTTTALAQINFNLTAFVTGLGILGFTVGFALQHIAQNFVAGILLLLQQPFKIGDNIKVGDNVGTVKDIEISTTTILTFDGLLVIIPNSQVFGNPLINYSATDTRRVSIGIGVSYDTNLIHATEVLLKDVTQKIPNLNPTPAPAALFNEFGDSSINGVFNFWIANTSRAEYLRTIDLAVKETKAAFDREGIEIPFPIRTLYMRQNSDAS